MRDKPVMAAALGRNSASTYLPSPYWERSRTMSAKQSVSKIRLLSRPAGVDRSFRHVDGEYLKYRLVSIRVPIS